MSENEKPTIEMFINPLKMPSSCYAVGRLSKHYEMAVKWYKEADEKAIFKVHKSESDYFNETGMLVVNVNGANIKLCYTNECKEIIFYPETLRELSELTHGLFDISNLQ